MDKTEIIIIGTPSLTTKVPADFTCDIAGTSIAPSSIVRHLELCLTPLFHFFLTLTLSLNWDSFTYDELSSFILSLVPMMQTLVHAFVSSRLDYCNALFIGLPATSIARLQYNQNSAARILTRSKRSAHITSILADLHWLPVAYCIKFIMILLIFKALNGLAPFYLL